jgi:hypothetical protein
VAIDFRESFWTLDPTRGAYVEILVPSLGMEGEFPLREVMEHGPAGGEGYRSAEVYFLAGHRQERVDPLLVEINAPPGGGRQAPRQLAICVRNYLSVEGFDFQIYALGSDFHVEVKPNAEYRFGDYVSWLESLIMFVDGDKVVGADIRVPVEPPTMFELVGSESAKGTKRLDVALTADRLKPY